MRNPFRKPVETRSQGGDFAATVLRTVELEAATKSADSAATAAVEAAAGLLGRELAGATVKGPEWLRDALTPPVLLQMGRDLIRPGATMHRIDSAGGRVRLHPVGQWHWVSGDGADPLTWIVKITESGPSSTLTWTLPATGVLWATWGVAASIPWVGKGALDWAALTARVNAAAERSLGHELSGPVANLIAVPDSGGKDGDDDADGVAPTGPSDALAGDIAGAQGRTILVETTAGGFGEGPSEAPQRDWGATRLGPDMPQTVTEAARDAFARILSAFGVPPGLFEPGADGTALQHGMRRYRLNVVEPVARLISYEVATKLGCECRLTFDPLLGDLQARAAALDKLVKAGMTTDAALAVVELTGGGNE